MKIFNSSTVAATVVLMCASNAGISNAEEVVSQHELRTTLAKTQIYGAGYAQPSGYKWNKNSIKKNDSRHNENIGTMNVRNAYKWTGTTKLYGGATFSPKQSEQYGIVDQSESKRRIPYIADQAGYKWGIRSNLDQAGYKWGIRSSADQAGYKWGIRSSVDQAGYKWGIRSSANQAGYKWGIRSSLDQAGYKWGIRSSADQAGYKWGIRSSTDQAGYKWGIRSSATQAGYKWGIR